jgi:hypothetical protein
LTGSSTQGGVVGRGVDRNHDGKIDSHDLHDPARSSKCLFHVAVV